MFAALGELLLVIGAMGAVFASVFQFVLMRWAFRQRSESTPIEQRIERLTTSLTETAQVAQQIEDEVNERRRLAEELRQDVETYNRIKELNREQVEAITQVVEEAATGEARRSFWRGVAINFGFFVLGAVVSVIAQLALG